MIFRNAADAFLSSLENVMSAPAVEVRGRTTRELRQQTLTLQFPLERAIAIRGRHNNVFAAIAETIWVIAGRDDIEFVQPYLPRAVDFSDDGVTWRGAYGPRLRNWAGVDQIWEIVHLLRREPGTRRASAIIFDPARDFADSLDIPCTNWLHFTIRDGRLDLEVAVRSNDLMWGFSGINTFEWSVLQEMVAHWTGAAVGNVTFFVSSLHLYDRHFERAADILARPTTIEHGPTLASERFATDFTALTGTLTAWFALERSIREGSVTPQSIRDFPDPLLRQFLWMLLAYWAFLREDQSIHQLALDHVDDRGLLDAATVYFQWKSGQEGTVETRATPVDVLRESVLVLHAGKDRIYGDSWKRRGEQMAVLANIARKVDRLAIANFDASHDVEGLLDTAADLYIYAVKYQTYLLEHVRASRENGDTFSSEGTASFEELVRKDEWPEIGSQIAIHDVTTTFDEIEANVAAGEPAASRVPLASLLAAQARELLVAVARLSPADTARTLIQWNRFADQP